MRLCGHQSMMSDAHRAGPNLLQNRICFSQIWLNKRLIFFFKKKTQRIEPFHYDPKNWTLFFSDMTQRIELLFSDMTQRIELFFSHMTQRTELFFLLRLKELNSLLNTTQQIQPFFHWLKELKFFQCDTVRGHTRKRTDGTFHRPCTTHHYTPTSTARGYTRADFGQEAVGGSTTTTRTRHKSQTQAVNTGGDLIAW